MLRIRADNEVHTVRDNSWGSFWWEQSGGLSAQNTNPEQRSSNQLVWMPKRLTAITGCINSKFVPTGIIIYTFGFYVMCQ